MLSEESEDNHSSTVDKEDVEHDGQRGACQQDTHLVC